MLNNHVFEELAMDVYDEVDRRETDAIWNSLVSKVKKRTFKKFPILFTHFSRLDSLHRRPPTRLHVFHFFP